MGDTGQEGVLPWASMLWTCFRDTTFRNCDSNLNNDRHGRPPFAAHRTTETPMSDEAPQSTAPEHTPAPMERMDQRSSSDASGPSRGSVRGFILTFVIMMITWCVLSGMFDSFHLTLGVISSLIVAWTSSDLLFATPESARLRSNIHIWLRFPGYICYLLVEIVKANWHVFKLCFAKDVSKAIDPHLIKFKSPLRSRMAMVTLANSITLTPGTITVNVDYDGVFTIHALDSTTAEALLNNETNEMQQKVAKVFGEA